MITESENSSDLEIVNSNDSGFNSYINGNGESSDNVSQNERKRSRYSLEVRKKVISHYNMQAKSYNKCAKAFNIDRRLVAKWVKMGNINQIIK